MTNAEYTRILIAVDGSEAAEHALNKGVEIAKRNHAHIDVLNVIDTRQFTGNAFDGFADERVIYNIEQRAEAEINDLKDRVQEDGFQDIDVHLRFGNPRTVIAIDAPKDYKSDLIVLGATGQSAISRIIMGSVASYVLRTAPCDVLIDREGMNKGKK